MQEFDELIQVADTLNNPQGGCPWDLSQTFQTLRSYILEEAHEALEAVDSGDEEHMMEELGDLLYTVVFYAKIAERENRFTLKQILSRLREKLIRRHPHIFGEKRDASIKEVMQKWEEIKKEEKKDRKSPLDGIPKTLPSLQRAYKITRTMKKKGYTPSERKPSNPEEELALQIFSLVAKGAAEGIDVESAFRLLLSEEEQKFIAWGLR